MNPKSNLTQEYVDTINVVVKCHSGLVEAYMNGKISISLLNDISDILDNYTDMLDVLEKL